MTRTGRWLRGSAGLAALVVTSQLLAITGIVPREFLPPAGEVLDRAAHLAGNRDFLVDLGATLRAWAIGVAIAVGIGATPGPCPGCARGRAGTRTSAARTWPVLYNTMYGLLEVDPVPQETLRVFGFGRVAVMWHVRLPAATPFMATGVRLAAVTALILAVSTEILAGFGDGLGVFIAQAQQAAEGTTDVLAGTVWSGALGLLINAVLERGERRLFGWHVSQSGQRR